MPETDRIPLHRTAAVISDGKVVIRPSGRLVIPLIQMAIAGGAVFLIIQLLNSNGSLVLLVVALLVAMLIGPAAVLGLVYNLVGAAVTVDGEKQSVVMQQGFLGLGIGTSELVPFWRIAHIEVAGDLDVELSGGELQDTVQWDILLVKDNDKIVELGIVVAARLFAAEALERANAAARAIAEVAGAELREGVIVEDAPEPADVAEAPRRRRRIDRGERRPPPEGDEQSEESKAQ